jgi:hypothetical protein
MTSAAIYARVSSARQKKDYTIGPQTAVCWEWMAITPAELPTVLGRGVVGFVARRVALQRPWPPGGRRLTSAAMAAPASEYNVRRMLIAITCSGQLAVAWLDRRTGFPTTYSRHAPPRHQTAAGPAVRRGRSRRRPDIGMSRPLARTASPLTSQAFWQQLKPFRARDHQTTTRGTSTSASGRDQCHLAQLARRRTAPLSKRSICPPEHDHQRVGGRAD